MLHMPDTTRRSRRESIAHTGRSAAAITASRIASCTNIALNVMVCCSAGRYWVTEQELARERSLQRGSRIRGCRIGRPWKFRRHRRPGLAGRWRSLLHWSIHCLAKGRRFVLTSEPEAGCRRIPWMCRISAGRIRTMARRPTRHRSRLIRGYSRRSRRKEGN